jgi:hypothetical protein
MSLKKCAPWVRVNRRLAGPVLVLSVFHIVACLAANVSLWRSAAQRTGLQQTGNLVGTGVLVTVICLAFTGFLLRQIMRDGNGRGRAAIEGGTRNADHIGQ